MKNHTFGVAFPWDMRKCLKRPQACIHLTVTNETFNDNET